jgi:hypothetical protein
MAGRLAGKVAVVSGGARGMAHRMFGHSLTRAPRWSSVTSWTPKVKWSPKALAARPVTYSSTQPDDMGAHRLHGSRGVRRRRHLGQQRRHHQRRPDRGVRTLGVAPHSRHQPDRRLPRYPGGRGADEGGRARIDHQHLFDRRDGRHHRLPRLHGHQVRRARADEIHCSGAGAQTALGRAAEPREVSSLVIYLASDESSYSTGSEFVVDGGCTAGLGHKDFSAVETEQQPEWVT